MSKKIKTLSDMKNDGSDPDSGNEDSEDKKNNRQAFYVGGSEKSGQQVLGPAKSKADEIVNNLFRQAREHGAEVVDKSQPRPSAAADSGSFSGGGFRLGDSASASASASVSAMADTASANAEPRSVHVRLQMWRNGFVIDDGPLRPYEEPENRAFLDCIMQNRIPPELLMKHRGSLIELDLENRKGDNYKPPTVVAQPFQGQGRLLGSLSPDVIGAGTVGIKAADSAIKETPKFVSSMVVDPSQPISNIQIRLADGGRLTAQFNLTHRIADIRNYITEAHPASANSSFVLMTSFPKQELTDENKTLKEVGLINVVIVQHLKPK